MKSSDDRITELEITLTHQQRYLDELNGVIIDLSRRFETLLREVSSLRQTVQRDQSSEPSEESE